MSDEATTESAVSNKAVRHRSPNYPMFDLESAVARASKFWGAVRRNTVDIDTAMQAIGYKASTAGGARALGALLSYGLLEEPKSTTGVRQFKISPEAYKLLVVLTPDDPERLEILREAALRPKVYSDIVKRFPDLTGLGDNAIRRFLLSEMNFNDQVVEDVIKDFRSTYTYATLAECGTLSEEESDKPDEEEEPPDDRIRRPKLKVRKDGRSSSGGGAMTGQSLVTQTRTLAIPMLYGRELLLQAPEAPIKSDMAYLELLESYIGLMKRQAETASDPPPVQDEEEEE